MKEREIIIVGGGPAGASCAARLREAGKDVLVLDRETFPRLKLCAGWITPRVLKLLGISAEDYPGSLLTFRRLHYFIRGRKISVPTRQYSIRRTEFDDWLIRRSGAAVEQHEVKSIRREGEYFIIDEEYRCKYLVGAGGTNCPVYLSLFREQNPRQPANRITTMELEFPYDYHDTNCYLWFFDNDLPGYSWYVPKGNGYLNIGIGGKFTELKAKGETIRQHWDALVEKLHRLELVGEVPLNPKGYNYYLRQPLKQVQIGNAYLIGDAAGLATLDMGEGIGPAVHSGILAAEAILTGKPLSLQKVPKYSFWEILFPWHFRPF